MILKIITIFVIVIFLVFLIFLFVNFSSSSSSVCPLSFDPRFNKEQIKYDIELMMLQNEQKQRIILNERKRIKTLTDRELLEETHLFLKEKAQKEEIKEILK